MTERELFELNVKTPDRGVYDRAKHIFDSLAKPIDGFGDLEDIICRIAAIRGNERFDMGKKAVIVMFADSRVVEEGVTQTDSSVTEAVARLTGEGKSTLCVMTGGYGIDVIGVDIGIDSDVPVPGILYKKVAKGAKNMAKEAAMSDDEGLAAITAGMDIAEKCANDGVSLIATGEMGIGNTTGATALLCALTGADPADVTGRGAGLDDEGLARKTGVITHSLRLHGFESTGSGISDRARAFDALCTVGGLDMAGLAGVFIGGALHGVPVIIDGLISAVAALAASIILPGTEKYMIASHSGREKGTGIALRKLGLKNLIDADMALGEGTGGVMIIPVIDMVFNVYNGGTSFETAKIQQYERFGI